MIKKKRLSWKNNYFMEKDDFVLAQKIKYVCHENYNKNLPRMKVVWSLQVWVTRLIGRKLWAWTRSKSIGKNRSTHPRRGSSCIYKRKYSHYVRMHFYFCWFNWKHFPELVVDLIYMYDIYSHLKTVRISSNNNNNSNWHHLQPIR